MTQAGFTLSGKVALVTGGSKGIGLAVAEALLEHGGSVAICARGAAEVEAVGRRLEGLYPKRVLAVACDVRHEVEVEAAFRAVDERFGGLDIVVNNAGVGSFKNLEKMTLEEWN